MELAFNATLLPFLRSFRVLIIARRFSVSRLRIMSRALSCSVSSANFRTSELLVYVGPFELVELYLTPDLPCVELLYLVESHLKRLDQGYPSPRQTTRLARA
jgi:hypothetical protein